MTTEAIWGYKDISEAIRQRIGRSPHVNTMIRWMKVNGLPIRRSKGAGLYVLVSELNEWSNKLIGIGKK